MALSYDFRLFRTRQALLNVIGIHEDLFGAVLAFDPAMDAQAQMPGGEVPVVNIPMFIRHDIPKKNKTRGCRTVWEPLLLKSEYKALARRLGSFFRLCLDGFPHDRAFGFVSGRNIRENASMHAGHKSLVSIDIADFFPSISRTRVEHLLLQLGLEGDVSDLMSRFVTIAGTLPAGLPTSPVVSNAVALPIDIELHALAERMEVTYSRYADDLTFSGNNQLPEVADIRDRLALHGFRMAEAKTRHSKIGQSHYVTGLSVSDPRRPHVSRVKKRTLRQEMYYARKFGLDGHFRRRGINDARVIQHEVNRLDGTVKFVAHHEPRMAPGLKEAWSGTLRASGMKPSFPPRRQDRSPFGIFIDEAEFNRPDGRVLAVGMAVSQHAAQIISEGLEILEAALADPWAAGKTSEIVKKGLHFADASEDLRLQYVTRLALMPFEGYVAFLACNDPSAYEATYMRLLNALITRRLMAAESEFAFILCEKNSKVRQTSVKACIRQAFEGLVERDDRRPKNYNVEFVTKPSLVVSVPDFLLGVLGKYLQSKPARTGMPEPRERLMFERLRDKYRLILDVATWTEYSRRRPIEPWDP